MKAPAFVLGPQQIADYLRELADADHSTYRVREIGFTERSFLVDDIERDLLRLRTLDFDEKKNTASRVAARLEYLLYIIPSGQMKRARGRHGPTSMATTK